MKKVLTALVLAWVLLFPASEASAKDRKPVVAGIFYPAGASEIKASIKHFFDLASSSPQILPENDLVGIIVPHAGWIYSGQTAAEGFCAISKGDFANVIFIGVDHRSGLNSIGLWPQGSFITPFAKTSVDENLNRLLLKSGLQTEPAQHLQEHSLEVILPFFQYLFPKLSAAFISCGSGIENGIRLGQALKECISHCRGKTLVIVSTDWSHYHDFRRAKALDDAGLASVLKLNTDELLQKCRNNETELCGLIGVIGAIELFKEAGATVKLLAQTDSSAASGDRERVVGYAALILQGQKSMLKSHKAEENSNMNFQQEVLQAVRATLEAHLSQKPIPAFNFTDPRYSEKRGMFVTLKKHGELRGCIGHIIGFEPLGKSLAKIAISSATQDPRFNPVTAAELNDIKIEVSILSPLEDVKDLNEIKIGRDGLLLQLGGRSGVFLPQVPIEWNWNLEEYLFNLCHKAGLPEGAHLDPRAHLQRFSADVFGEE